MRSVFSLFGVEMRRLFSNVITVIITIGLVLMPSLFTWYNVLSCWDVFDKTGDLSVAVASVDEGYESDLFPLEVNVGESVISALRANDQINWVFTTEDDAIDGARAGRYYAAVIIPEGFSRAMLTFYQEGAEQAPLIYYTNEKKNAIAPKITDQGADGVSAQVNQVFAETITDIALRIAKSVSQYMDDADVQSRIALLANHVNAMADRMDQMVGVLGLYGNLAGSAESILGSTSSLVGNVRSSAGEVADIARQSISQAQGTVEALNAAMDAMVQAIQASIGAIDQIEGETPDFDQLPDAKETADQLRKQAADVGTQIDAYTAMRDALIDASAGSGSGAGAPGEGGEGGTTPAPAPDYSATIAALNAAIDELTALQEDLLQTADDIEAGNVSIDDALISKRAEEAKAALERLQSAIEDELRPVMQQIQSELASLQDSAASLGTVLGDSADHLQSAIASASSGLGGISGTIANASARLSEASSTLRELGDAITHALSAEDRQELYDLLGSNISTFSSALTAPIAVERTALFESENFGSSMTPLYATLGLFVGALLIMVCVKPRPDQRVLDEVQERTGRVLKPRHEFFGHFGVCAFISIAQSLILALGNMLFVGVQIAHPWLFLLCYMVSSLVFTFFIYAMVVSFANLGKAVAVVLLIIQVTGCNGSYPLQLLPWFVQAISPFLPATHVVAAMREAMFGTFGNVFWEQMGLVAVWLLPALALGLFLRKPFAKFMHWYVEKVEDSKLMN